MRQQEQLSETGSPKKKRRSRSRLKYAAIIIISVAILIAVLVVQEAIRRHTEATRPCSQRVNYGAPPSMDYETEFDWDTLKAITDTNTQQIKHLATLAVGAPVINFTVHFSPNSRLVVVTGVPAGISTLRFDSLIWKLDIGLNCFLELKTTDNFHGFSPDSEMVIFRDIMSEPDEYYMHSVRYGRRIDGQVEQDIVILSESSDELINQIISQLEVNENESIKDAVLSPDKKLVVVARGKFSGVYTGGYVELWGIPANDEQIP